MADLTQKVPTPTSLRTAEFYLDNAIKFAAGGDLESSRRLFEAAGSAALVSLARTLDDLNGKLGLCGHGYVWAICHLCMQPLR